MTDQIWLLLVSAAITVVFTRGTIFQWFRGPYQRAPQTESRLVRLFRDLAACPLCAGVWFGWAVSLAYDHAGSWGLMRAINFLGFGCLSAVIALAVFSALDWLQAPHWEAPAGQQVAPPPPVYYSQPDLIPPKQAPVPQTMPVIPAPPVLDPQSAAALAQTKAAAAEAQARPPVPRGTARG